MKSQHKFLVGGLIIFAVIAALSIEGLQDMTVYFYTPQEVLAEPEDFDEKTIRIGALVAPGSVTWDSSKVRLAFQVTEDSQHFIPVIYQGVKPDMFREGQGVVVEGKFRGDTLHADQLLVKHSEEYKVKSPDEVHSKEHYYQSVVN